MVDEISLYFHLPFCTKKCPYCHFYVIPNKEPLQNLLFEALMLEWEREKEKLFQKELISIYFGGGTPALFTKTDQILQKIPYRKGCEITIEANPEESSEELFTRFLEMGINRLSIGVQSLDDRSLQTLERIHSAKKAKEAIIQAKRAGFQNITIDLMYDLPNQTEASFRHTLDEVKTLGVQHVSLYNLTIEPNTLFFRREVKPLQGELSLKLLNLAVKKLEEMGLFRYEISAFCKPGFESKHNMGYWQGREFLGLGPSAFSYFQKTRYRNIANLFKYHRLLKEEKSPVDFEETLCPKAMQNELLAIGLRVKKGVDLQLFELSDETIRALDRLEKGGFLQKKGRFLALTEKGTLFYDSVAVEII